MLDINLVRNNPEIIREDLKKRGDMEKLVRVDQLLELDKLRRESITRANDLKHRRNKASQELGRLKKQGEDISSLIKEIKDIPLEIKDLDETIRETQEKMNSILMRMPNILHESVPAGDDESGNLVVKEWGGKGDPGFTPRDHIDLGLSLDLFDTDRAAKTSGSRFYYLKNELARLNHALINFALDFIMEKGFTLMQPPYMLRRAAEEASTDLADFEDVIYKIQDEDLYLIPTSEHTLLAYHMGEIIDTGSLPLLYAGISPCFRKEAGAHGRDTKGIFRVHQFEKVEMFIYCNEDDSWGWHEKMISYAEEIYQKLDIPYRVVNICTGDIGTVAAKKYDLEAWMPGQGNYREVVSCSNCTDYQGRRANIRYRDNPGDPTKAVHTLNSTLVATERTLVAIMENHQKEDGSIRIPSVLVPYMNGRGYIKP